MRFEVDKSLDNDDYVIWDNSLNNYYCFGGIVLRGSKSEMDKAAADLNYLNRMKQAEIQKERCNYGWKKTDKI